MHPDRPVGPRCLPSAEVVSSTLQVENQLLKTQLQTLAATVKMMKLENNQLHEQKDRFLLERDQLCTRLREAEDKARDASSLRDRVVVLEAELERLAEYVQETTASMDRLQAEKKQNEAAIAAAQQDRSQSEADSENLRQSLHAILQRLYALTMNMLPSFVPSELQNEATTTAISDHLADGISFLSEVFKARTEASAMIREKMKTEQLELQAKLSVAAHKETVLQEGLRMSEDNMQQERDMFAMQVRDIEEKGRADVSHMKQEIADYQERLEEAAHVQQRLQSSKAEVDRSLIARCDELTASESRFKKEVAARRHLQRLLGEEQTKRSISDKQVKELKLQMKLCGAGHAATLSEVDLVNMVSRLNGEQGALEVENCDLRDKLAGVRADDETDSCEEMSIQDQIDAALQGDAAAGADIALAETLLERNMRKLSDERQ
eukprot:TRINITY_DN59660_c0_g1_i1.p1 TRINITY_DN59660_c0_g1~~TRINITY_DN59660_c0_g1_i1.p1  ORF type:complete len:451 (+),score=140.93 TRINITY_DN59660_c0_g1_i1:47-1354(+)